MRLHIRGTIYANTETRAYWDVSILTDAPGLEDAHMIQCLVNNMLQVTGQRSFIMTGLCEDITNLVPYAATILEFQSRGAQIRYSGGAIAEDMIAKFKEFLGRSSWNA